MIDDKWIKTAQEHFKENGDKAYIKDDAPSKESIRINNELKELLNILLNSDNEVILDIKGNKWGKQGHLKLNPVIWYRIYYKEFGEKHPIVFGVHIGKSGLKIAIQIYESTLNNDDDLCDILGGILATKINSKNPQQLVQENNKRKKCSGFASPNIVTKSEFDVWFPIVLNIYKTIVKEINKEIFDEMIILYNKSHSLIIDNQRYISRKEVRKSVDKFLTTPTKENFEFFWNRDVINSARQSQNATKIISSNGSFKNIKDKVSELVKCEQIQGESTQDFIAKINGIIANSNEASLALYYYYNMVFDRFPFISTEVENSVNIIERNGITFTSNDLIVKINDIKNKLSTNTYYEKSYLVDHFLNFIDRLSKIEIKSLQLEIKKLKNIIKGSSTETEKLQNHQRLYSLTYLFSFWQPKHQTNNANLFDTLIQRSKNIIFYGAPGTGKTYTAEENILRIIVEHSKINCDVSKRFYKVQFHPSYAYEDFMEGLKPVLDNNNQIKLELTSGDFSKFCNLAKEYVNEFINEKVFEDKLEYSYFFLVDEINRAELSRVFGELMYCLEKRGHSILTQYSYLKKEDDNLFYVPENIFFIGTMNDVDKSIDSFDLALRRRFLWHRMDCDYYVIKDDLSLLSYSNIGDLDSNDRPISGYLNSCYVLNKHITNTSKDNLGLGKIYEIGHAYFLEIKNYVKHNTITTENLKDLFDDRLEPLLKEYLRSEFRENEIDQHIENAKIKFIKI